MKKILIILCLSFILYGCSNTDDIQKLMKENDYIIIDVRTEEEYNESHISGAVNIPYDQIYKNLKIDKDKIVFVYCKSGNRSRIAFTNLKNLGYTVYDLGAFSDIDLPRE